MNVLIVDSDRVGLDFALRCAASGHEVRWFRYSRAPVHDGEGFSEIKIVDDWRPHMAWAKDGLILLTNNNRFLYEIDRYREHGFRIFGPTVASANLEIDRGAGMKAMRAAGIEVPPYHEFGSFEEAYRFARKSNDAWVFKPLGDENDKSLTYVSRSPDDLVGWLKHKIETGKVLKGTCILQQKIDVLAEVGVSGWVGPEGFLPDKWQVCFEHKKLMSGEVGPQTGEMGTVCGYAEDDRLADEMLRPMEPILCTLGHRGDFAVGAIIDHAGKAWPCEFTARCGWPTFWIQTASHRGDPAKWMRDLLEGKDSLRVSYDVAIGVVCAQPPFPYNTNPTINTVGNRIFCEAPADQVHPVSVMRRGGEWQTTDSYVLVVTALGKTVSRAREKVYRAVKQVDFADMQYRDDIGEKLESPLPALHKAGWAKEIAY